MKTLLLILLVSCLCLPISLSAQNSVKFRHIIKQKHLSARPAWFGRQFIYKLAIKRDAKRAVKRAGLPPDQQQAQVSPKRQSTELRFVDRNPVYMLEPLPLVYREVKSMRTKPYSFCSPKLNCVIKMNGQVPVVDFWRIQTAGTASVSTAAPCINPDTPLGLQTFKKESTQDKKVVETRTVPSRSGNPPTINKETIQVTETTETTVTEDLRFELDLTRSTVGTATRVVKVPFRTFTFGVGTIPFRVRGKYEGKKDYLELSSAGLPQKRPDTLAATTTAQISFVINSGFTWGYSAISHRTINHYAITVGPFLGMSAADLKKNVTVNPADYKYDKSLPALSAGLNLILSRNNFGLLVSAGFDHALGSNRKEWVYQDKLWFGLGINTSLGYF